MKEELANLVRTFEALGPIVGNAVKSGQLLLIQLRHSARSKQPPDQGESLSLNRERSIWQSMMRAPA